MFEDLVNFLNSGSTGLFVSLVIEMESFLRERWQSSKQATIDEYLEWLRRKNHSELLEGQEELLKRLTAGNEEAAIARELVSRLLSQVAALDGPISQILKTVSGTEAKIDLIIEKLSEPPANSMPHLGEGQVAVSAEVLEALSAGVKGAGYRSTLKYAVDAHVEGTIGLVWRVGTRSPHMILVDYVGGISDNQLAAKARRGKLSAVEDRELQGYLLVGSLVDLLHSKARRSLKRGDNGNGA